MSRKIVVIGLLLLGSAATAQLPMVTCPVHNVPAYLTGQTKRDSEGRTIAYQYCHTSGFAGEHCFWVHT